MVRQKEVENFVELGAPIFKRKREGAALNLELKEIRHENALGINENCYAIGSASMECSRYLTTYRLHTCVAISTYNTKMGIGILAHARNEHATIEALRISDLLIRPDEVFVYGGSRSWDRVLFAIEGYLIERNGMAVIGMDTEWSVTPNPSDDTRNIGIDMQNGRPFLPVGVATCSYGVSPIVTQELHYCGPSIASFERLGFLRD